MSVYGYLDTENHNKKNQSLRVLDHKNNNTQ